MPMTANITVRTDGYDDAESVAAGLEQLAALIRAAGGDQVIETGTLIAMTADGQQFVDYDITTGA